jgi:hypothetical protein
LHGRVVERRPVVEMALPIIVIRRSTDERGAHPASPASVCAFSASSATDQNHCDKVLVRSARIRFTSVRGNGGGRGIGEVPAGSIDRGASNADAPAGRRIELDAAAGELRRDDRVAGIVGGDCFPSHIRPRPSGASIRAVRDGLAARHRR